MKRRHRTSTVGSIAALVAMAFPRVLIAQPATDKALAEQLFQDGKRAMDAGDYAQACPKLAESQRLDPGGGTLLNLALCHKLEGRTATAWAEFTEAIAVARRDGRADREEEATKQRAELEPKLSKLAIRVDPKADVPGLVISRNGLALGRASWGVEMLIDPGEYVFEAHAPGYEPWTANVTVGRDGDRQTVDIAALERLAAPPPPIVVPPIVPPSVVEDPGRTQRIAGFTVGAAGIAGLVIGTVAGPIAIVRQQEADEICPGTYCPLEAVELNREARAAALVADVGFGVGAGLVGIGLAVVLTAPAKQVGPVPRPTANGLFWSW